MMACNGGVWGACIGDRITTKKIPGSGIHALNYGTAGGCTDLCDPLCNQTVDTPDQLDGGADSGLATNDAGGFGPAGVIPSDGGVPCNGLAVSPSTLNVTVTSLSPIATSPATATLTATYTPPGCY
ncbi:MAG TPA: hypothetical protein VGY54_21075, partial [Polyangiaceae bacterium]|nr:hypothetical protein [Polyangiaceae bacterium]